MEHYSRDRVVLRVLNLITYLIMLIAVGGVFLKKWGPNFYKIFEKSDFIMSPVKYMNVIYIAGLLFLAGFIIVQLDSREHGTGKRVIENYGFATIVSFIFVTIWGVLLLKSYLLLSFLAIMVSLFTAIVIYVKAHQLKNYMYNDEIAVFVMPFSSYVSLVLTLFLTTIGILLTNVQFGRVQNIVFSCIMVLISIGLSVISQIKFKDKIFVIVQIFYLIAIAIQRWIAKDFMPMGYICFLAVIAILIVYYKVFGSKNVNHQDNI